MTVPVDSDLGRGGPIPPEGGRLVQSDDQSDSADSSGDSKDARGDDGKAPSDPTRGSGKR